MVDGRRAPGLERPLRGLGRPLWAHRHQPGASTESVTVEAPSLGPILSPSPIVPRLSLTPPEPGEVRGRPLDIETNRFGVGPIVPLSLPIDRKRVGLSPFFLISFIFFRGGCGGAFFAVRMSRDVT